MADSFRMDMSGDKSYREDALDSAVEVFGENTRSGAVVKACEHARLDKRAKVNAVSYAIRNLEPEQAAEIINRLATPQLPISAKVRFASDQEGVISEVNAGKSDRR